MAPTVSNLSNVEWESFDWTVEEVVPYFLTKTDP